MNESPNIVLGLELSHRELLALGNIVAQWGLLEHQIFFQTLECFADVEEGPPKKLNGIQFTETLLLWEKHVVESTADAKREVLRDQVVAIKQCKPVRDALVHGMLDWNKDAQERISSIRVNKKQFLVEHFTAQDLEKLSRDLGKINFHIRYPGGVEDRAVELAEAGSYISRRALSMFSDSPVADDFLPPKVAGDNA
jgi:hypothetical protein